MFILLSCIGLGVWLITNITSYNRTVTVESDSSEVTVIQDSKSLVYMSVHKWAVVSAIGQSKTTSKNFK